MIVKLVKTGGITQHIEADSVLQQPVVGGRIDLEIEKLNQPVRRVLIGELEPRVIDEAGVWQRAYIMEHGKTVDTIRGHLPPQAPAPPAPPV